MLNLVLLIVSILSIVRGLQLNMGSFGWLIQGILLLGGGFVLLMIFLRLLVGEYGFSAFLGHLLYGLFHFCVRCLFSAIGLLFRGLWILLSSIFSSAHAMIDDGEQYHGDQMIPDDPNHP